MGTVDRGDWLDEGTRELAAWLISILAACAIGGIALFAYVAWRFA